MFKNLVYNHSINELHLRMKKLWLKRKLKGEMEVTVIEKFNWMNYKKLKSIFI